MTDIVTTELTADEARELTAEMNLAARRYGSIAKRLQQARDLRVWMTLGYATFSEYCAVEFGEASLRAASLRGLISEFDRSPVDRRAVYFIQAVTGGLVKIGVATDPVARLAEIQRMCPVPLRILGVLPGVGQARESSLHRTFASDRQHGEWFRPSPELMRIVAIARGQSVAA